MNRRTKQVNKPGAYEHVTETCLWGNWVSTRGGWNHRGYQICTNNESNSEQPLWALRQKYEVSRSKLHLPVEIGWINQNCKQLSSFHLAAFLRLPGGGGFRRFVLPSSLDLLQSFCCCLLCCGHHLSVVFHSFIKSQFFLPHVCLQMGRRAEDRFRIWCLTGGGASRLQMLLTLSTRTSTVLCPHWPASSRTCPAGVSSASPCWAAAASAAPARFPEPAGKFGSSASIPSARAPLHLTPQGRQNPLRVYRFIV